MTAARRAFARTAVLAAAFGCALSSGCGDHERTPPVRLPASPSRSFVGLVSEDVFAGGPRYRARTLAAQRAAGVGLLRQTIDWSRIETAPGRYDFRGLDAYLGALARRRIELLPVLFGTPRFRSSAPRKGARHGAYPPSRAGALGHFGAALARRYGPGGRFWRAHPRLRRVPIRAWQVWNEPNLPAFWASGPDPAAYARLLRVTGRGIRRVDPRAQIVSAGIAQSRLGIPFRAYVRGMFAAGAAPAVDVFAIHPYAANAGDVTAAVAGARDLLSKLGAHPPIWITEVGWASGGPRSPFTVGERGQAGRITRLFRQLLLRRRELGLRGIVYYDWKDARPYPGGHEFFGLHTGLLRRDGEPKPALRAFRRAARGHSQ